MFQGQQESWEARWHGPHARAGVGGRPVPAHPARCVCGSCPEPTLSPEAASPPPPRWVATAPKGGPGFQADSIYREAKANPRPSRLKRALASENGRAERGPGCIQASGLGPGDAGSGRRRRMVPVRGRGCLGARGPELHRAGDAVRTRLPLCDRITQRPPGAMSLPRTAACDQYTPPQEGPPNNP